MIDQLTFLYVKLEKPSLFIFPVVLALALPTDFTH
jgi:hypothetical protein